MFTINNYIILQLKHTLINQSCEMGYSNLPTQTIFFSLIHKEYVLFSFLY